MIVIKDGKNFAKIYADKAFDKWGRPVSEDIRIVENWSDLAIPITAEKIDANLPYSVNFDDYIAMITNTLWIFNNDTLKIKDGDIFMTGAGINWMFQKGKTNIFDISKVQVKFIQNCIKNWNGTNYGKFVYDFIIKNKIIHYHCNLSELQNSDKSLIANKHEFIQHINDNFEMLKNKYDKNWKWDPTKIEVQVGNLMEEISKHHLGKFLLTNIFDFKYYYAKLYTKDAHSLLTPSTKTFISKIHKGGIEKKQNVCEKIDLNVPAKEIFEEIHSMKKYFCIHRDDSGIGWESFCIHGQAYNRTKEKSYYPDFLGYKWTQEAVANMPCTIAWLKSLGYKSFNRVRVMCLQPKGFINLHKDQNHNALNAVNVAINNPKDCVFYLQNYGILDFQAGVSYKLNLSNYHAVVNNSNVPRYHIIIHGDK